MKPDPAGLRLADALKVAPESVLLEKRISFGLTSRQITYALFPIEEICGFVDITAPLLLKLIGAPNVAPLSVLELTKTSLPSCHTV